MASKINWTEQTWEVTGGCTKLTDGCRECWAIREVWRMAHNPLLGDKWKGLVEKKNGVLNWTGEVKCFEDTLNKPQKRKKPTTYFVDSKADLFHEKVPWGFIEKVMATIEECPQHTFQILTKRPHSMAEYFNGLGKRFELSCCPNLHLGVTIENQAMADKRIPILLQIPAAVRFVSIEPMLGPVDLKLKHWVCSECGNWTDGEILDDDNHCSCDLYVEERWKNEIDWVIVGGESGPKARPMHPDWVRSVRDQCIDANVPFFFKQWGEWGPVSCYIPANRKRHYCFDPPSKATPRLKEYNGLSLANMYRYGKKKAGNLLDGKVWEQYPL